MFWGPKKAPAGEADLSVGFGRKSTPRKVGQEVHTPRGESGTFFQGFRLVAPSLVRGFPEFAPSLVRRVPDLNCGVRQKPVRSDGS